MAADQRKKRLNGANSVGYSSWDQYRVKKKKLGSHQNDRNMKSHISLEWDGNEKKVVAKREQVGISWRGLKPYRETAPRYHNILAAVVSVPLEIFELENLTDVLSYEVWQTQLSENERSYLMQFLPSGPDEEGLQALFAGDNLHFGNPFLKWGAALCSGNLHPDAVLHQELHLKTDNEVYHWELLKYHENLIKCFQEGKERCANSDDPEKEITQMWRSRTDTEKRISEEDRFHDFEENVEATSESCSWVADEKTCSSDNQNSSVMKSRELERRTCEKSTVKNKSRNQPVSSDGGQNAGVRARKGDKLLKPDVSCSDGAKYMSYFKISKKQHELVKSMKQSGKNIQSKSLNRILGNLDGYHVQPYEVFEEEEQKKLHKHWLNLVHRDLPEAYAKRRGRQTEIQKLVRLLEQEMKDRPTFSDENDLTEEETPVNEMQTETEAELIAHESIMQDAEESVSISPGNQSPQQIRSLDGNLNHVDMDSESNHVLSKSDDVPEDESRYSGNLNSADITVVSQEIPVLSQGVAWQADDMAHSYYGATANLEYTSPSLGHPQPQMNEEQHAHMVDLGTDLHMKDVLHSQPDNVPFSSYPTQDGNGLLQSLFKSQGTMPSYHQEQRTMGLHFQSPNMSTEDSPFPRHFQHPQAHLQPLLQLEQGQRRQNQVHMQHNLSENIYSDGGRYFIPRQEHLPPAPASVQDWAVNQVPMSAPLLPHLNGGGLLTQNWFSGDHQVQGAWAGSDHAGALGRSIGGGSNADQSLYTVLSQCNSLRAGTSYDSMRTTEQVISPRNYGMLSAATPRMSNALPQTANPLEYLGGREAAATSLMTDEMVWMSLPHQNPALHDSTGKPFLRRWNQ